MEAACHGLLHVVHQTELARIGGVAAAHVVKGSIEVRCIGCRSSFARRPNERQQQNAADADEVGVEQGVPKSREREGCDSDRSAEDEADLEGAPDDPARAVHAASSWLTWRSSLTTTSASIACSFMASSIS